MHLFPKIVISLSLVLSIPLVSFSSFAQSVVEDLPEEILRGEIITEARSSLDGQILSAEQYAALMTELQTSPFAPELKPNLNRLIFLLQLRQFIRLLFPVF